MYFSRFFLAVSLLFSLTLQASQEISYTITGTYLATTTTDSNPNFELTAQSAEVSYNFTVDADNAVLASADRTDIPGVEVTYTVNGVTSSFTNVTVVIHRSGLVGLLGVPDLNGSGNNAQLNLNLPAFTLFSGQASSPYLNDGSVDFDGGFYDTAQFSGTLNITPPPGAVRYTVLGNFAAGANTDTNSSLDLTAPDAQVFYSFFLDPDTATVASTDRTDFPNVNVAYNLNGVVNTLSNVTVAMHRSGILGLLGAPNLDGSGNTAQANLNLPASTLFFGPSSKPILNKVRLSFTSGFYDTEPFSGVLSIGATESKLINISTRANVSNAQGDLFHAHAGFHIQNGTKKRVFVRGVSPAVEGAISNGFIKVFKLGSPNTLVAENDDWENNSRVDEVRELASHLIPQNSTDAALLLDLAPGTYSVLLSPAPGSADGVGLVSIDEVNP